MNPERTTRSRQPPTQEQRDARNARRRELRAFQRLGNQLGPPALETTNAHTPTIPSSSTREDHCRALNRARVRRSRERMSAEQRDMQNARRRQRRHAQPSTQLHTTDAPVAPSTTVDHTLQTNGILKFSMSSQTKMEPPPVSEQKKRAFDALERRFALARAELIQEEQSRKRKEPFDRQDSGAEVKRDKFLSATTVLSTPKSQVHPSKQGKDFHPAYSYLLEGMDENLINRESNISNRGEVVNKLIYDILQHGDEWNKFRRTSLKKKIDHCLLLDNFVPNVGVSMDARGKALQSHSKRSQKHMSLQQHRKCGSFNVPKEFYKFELFQPMHDMWKAYILELMQESKKNQLAQRLLTADLHGAYIVVAECKTSSFVGVRGIMIRETTETFGIIKQDNKFRVVPKHGSVFMFQAGCWKIILHGDKLALRNLP